MLAQGEKSMAEKQPPLEAFPKSTEIISAYNWLVVKNLGNQLLVGYVAIKFNAR